MQLDDHEIFDNFGDVPEMRNLDKNCAVLWDIGREA